MAPLLSRAEAVAGRFALRHPDAQLLLRVWSYRAVTAEADRLGRVWPRLRLVVVFVIVACTVAFALAPPDAQATFPGRNGPIVFELMTSGEQRLAAVNPGTGRRLGLQSCGPRRPRGSECHDSDPHFSPDGRRLVYVRGRGGFDPEPVNSALVVARADGSVLRTLRKPWFDGGPFSPNGGRLLFAARRRGMATMSTTTGRLRRINRAPGDFLGADWSSRNRIVYQRRYVDDDLVDSIGIDLYAVNPAGGRLRRLTTTGAANSASWSPDGRRLVYSQFRGASSASAIWVMNADGSNKKRISNGYYPIWSPDEQRVAFVRNYGDIQRTDIVVARPDGTHQRRVLSVYDRIPTERGIGQLAWRPLRAGGNRR